MSYEAMILLPPESQATLDEAEEKLRNRFGNTDPATIILRQDEKITLAIEDWSARIYLISGPHVIVESRELAEQSAVGRPDKEEIASCRRRVEIASDPDPNMDYFNEFLYIMEEIGSFPGAKTWDAADGEFMDMTQVAQKEPNP